MKQLSHVVEERMRRMLNRNRAYRRDMAAAGRAGIFYFAEMLIETKLLIDHFDGKNSKAKSLVMEVAPDWVSETTAHRIIRDLKKNGYVTLETDADDHRSQIIRPTTKMVDRSERRWMRVDDERPSSAARANRLTPEPAAERSRGAYGVATLANWRRNDVGPDFMRLGGKILYPLDELERWESRPMTPTSRP